MGNCHKSKPLPIVYYSKAVAMFIKAKDEKGKQISKDRVHFYLKPPIDELVEIIELSKAQLKISACVVGGQDPRQEIEKSCQDGVFVASKPNYALLTLFDGHGPDGESVVRFSESFMRQRFLSEDLAGLDCEDFLTDLYISCDDQLKNLPNIDIYGSGTTVVSILFTPKGIYTASVGDSRAILATVSKKIIEPPETRAKNKYRTDFTVTRALESIQLTVDQKPNIEEELFRIVNAGGTVSRAKDHEGKGCGPFRVFQKGKDIPGLAMSRSLGDLSAKKVGVVALPMLAFYPIIAIKDQFIVIASDGVWDTMDNNEVTNFVETFRSGCCQNLVDCSGAKEVQQGSSTIAKFLVEEARLRWLGICEEEDGMIDDISAMVAEIYSNELPEEDGNVQERIGKEDVKLSEAGVEEETVKKVRRITIYER